MEYCLNSCPNLKSLDTRKVTVEMRNDPNSVVFDDKNNDGKGTDGGAGQTITHDSTVTQSDAINNHIMPQVSTSTFASPVIGANTTTVPSVIANATGGPVPT